MKVKCKGNDGGMSLECSNNYKETEVAGAVQAGKRADNEISQPGPERKNLTCHGIEFASHSECDGK